MIPVLRTGLRVLPTGTGSVLHISERAINIDFGERVVTLLNRQGILTPSSIILDADYIPGFNSAYFNGILLNTDTFSAEIRNGINLAANPAGNADLKLIRNTLRPHIVGKERSIMGAVLLAEGSESVHVPEGIEGMILEDQARRLKKCTNMESAVQSLLGLGFGLTPSGDDFILGAISAMQLSGRSVSHLRIPIADYKNAFSRTMLLDGLDGYFPEPLLRLIKVLDTAGDPEREIADLLRIGHTSGYDMVAGIYYAAAKLIPPRVNSESKAGSVSRISKPKERKMLKLSIGMKNLIKYDSPHNR